MPQSWSGDKRTSLLGIWGGLRETMEVKGLTNPAASSIPGLVTSFSWRVVFPLLWFCASPFRIPLLSFPLPALLPSFISVLLWLTLFRINQDQADHFKHNFIYFCLCWVILAVRDVLWLQRAGATLLLQVGGGAQALRPTGFDSCGAWAQYLQFPHSRAPAQ